MPGAAQRRAVPGDERGGGPGVGGQAIQGGHQGGARGAGAEVGRGRGSGWKMREKRGKGGMKIFMDHYWQCTVYCDTFMKTTSCGKSEASSSHTCMVMI